MPPELPEEMFWPEITRGEEVVDLIWCTCAGSVLYAVDGNDIDCFEPFFKLPTIWEAKFEPETKERT